MCLLNTNCDARRGLVMTERLVKIGKLVKFPPEKGKNPSNGHLKNDLSLGGVTSEAGTSVHLTLGRIKRKTTMRHTKV
jgi:hypothetical protein